MTNDMADTSKLGVLTDEAKILGVKVLPPDVNESHVFFAPAREGTVIRFGMAAIKGVGSVAVEDIIGNDIFLDAFCVASIKSKN